MQSFVSFFFIMSYRYLLTSLGILLIVLGLIERGWFLAVTWLGCNFLILGIAHARGAHSVFGKRNDGTLPAWSWILFFPLLAYTMVVWHLVRVFGREPAQNAVTDWLVVGRRLLPSEVKEKFNNFVDLTTEFCEPRAIRDHPSYRSFPILDGSAPTPEALHAMITTLKRGRTYVHCAQGHGRTGLFALALLLNSSRNASDVQGGLRMLQSVRPDIQLNREQQKCIELYAKNLATGSRTTAS